MSTAPTNIVAIGQAALTLRTTVAKLNTVADTLGIRPAMTINGVPFLDAADIDRLAAAMTRPANPLAMMLDQTRPLV